MILRVMVVVVRLGVMTWVVVIVIFNQKARTRRTCSDDGAVGVYLRVVDVKVG